MGKISSDFKIPKRIGDFVIYPLDGEYIIRKKSGFTKKGMAKDPKYARSRENAKEFGAVSRLSKNIRMALKEVLPTSNNLAVCNSLTSIMRKVMCCDEAAERGYRSLKNGFETDNGKVLFTGYDFNPNSLFLNVFKGDYQFDIEKRVLHFDSFKTVEAFVFPEGANCVGLRMGVLRFDFNTTTSFFNLTDWSLFPIESSITEVLKMGIEDVPEGEGNVLFLLEVAFFAANEDSYLSFGKNDTKVVFVLGVA